MTRIRSRSTSRSDEMPTPPSSCEMDSLSMMLEFHGSSVLSQSPPFTAGEPVASTGIDHVLPQRSLDPSDTQNFTFRCLHNSTPEPFPQATKPHPVPAEIEPFELESSPLPIPSPSMQASPLISPPDVNNGIILFDESTGSKTWNKDDEDDAAATKRTEDPLYQGSDVSMQLVGPSGMIEPLDTSIGRSLRAMRLSDASIATEDDIETMPYAVRDETAPEEPFFSPSFQGTLRKSLTIANETAVAIDACVRALSTEDALVRLCADATALSSFQGSDTRTIAILGDSGEGKSSLINSLLHYAEVAKTGDIGSACTSVVTEYRQKQPNQTAEILLEVEYLSVSQIDDLINELLWDFRKFYLPHVESQKTSAQDYARWQKESDQAWSALESAFKHKRRFSERFLKDTSDGASERIATQLVSWANELQWPEGGTDGVWSSTADSAEECCAKTSLFMKDQFWPFTKVIRVFLGAQVLQTGVVLADLPGLHDTNLARVRITQEYLMKCDLFLIVANIARAITNQSLKSSLHTVLSRHMPMEWNDESGRRNLNFAFVCTMAENFNIETEKRDFCGPGKPIPSSTMRQLDEEIKQAKRRGDRKLKKELKRRQEVMLMDARNDHVKRGLQEVYSTRVPNGSLEVFCVSNSWYKKYTRKGNTRMVNASGIPDLRRFCHSVTAQAQLMEAQNYMQAKMQGLLNSVNLWATSHQTRAAPSHQPSPEVLGNKMKVVRRGMLDNVNDAKSSFLETFDEMLSPYFNRRDEFWESDALDQHKNWASWHWTQYNAWCMNNGSHATSKRAFVDWNAEIIWKMRSELAIPWQILEDEVSSCFDKLLQDIKKLFRNLKKFIKSQKLSSLVSEGIDLQMRDLQYHIGLLQTSFSKEIRRIRRYTFEPCGNSYILGEMVPAYRAASRESGAGKAVRQRNHVRSKIEGGTLFSNIEFRIRSGVEPLVDVTFCDAEDLVRRALKSVRCDIRASMPVDKSHPLAANYKEVQAIKELATTIEALRKRHVSALEEISDL